MLRQTLSAVSQNPTDWNSIFQLIRLFDLHHDKKESIANLLQLAQIVGQTNLHFAKRILKKTILVSLENQMLTQATTDEMNATSLEIAAQFLSQKPFTVRSTALESFLRSANSQKEVGAQNKIAQKEQMPGLEIQINSLEKNKKTRSKTVVGKVLVASHPVRPKPSQVSAPAEPIPAKQTTEEKKQSAQSAKFEQFFQDSKLPKQFHSLALFFTDSPEGILLFCAHLHHLESFSDKNKKILCTKLGKFLSHFHTSPEFSKFAHQQFPYFAENYFNKELNFS